MLPDTHRHALGVVVEELLRESLKHWRHEYAGGSTLEQALADHVEAVNTSFTLRPGGRVHVSVSVLCRLQHRNESYYYQLQRTGKRGYLLR